MQIAPEIQELEALAQSANVQIKDALAHAGVSQSTYWRWRHEGRDPLVGTLRRVRAAIDQLKRAA
jgi:predicted DNA-binding protein (UPF0251 family)